MSSSLALRCCFVLLLSGSSVALAATSVLDTGFGQAGIRLVPEMTGGIQGIGSCPHADGSISVVGHRATSASLVTVRLLANGSLDRSFSGDGMADQQVFFAIDTSRTTFACAGVGNADPADDRMMIAATSPGTRDTGLLVLLDLTTGGYDASFGLGGPMQHDYSGLLFPSDGAIVFPRLQMRGAQQGNGGEWLITGRLDGSTEGLPRGFIARVTPRGAIEALSQPNAPGHRTLDLSVSRIGGDGSIRALGTQRNLGSSVDSWGLLRLESATLQFQTLAAAGIPNGFSYEVQGGRRIAGGVLVAAAIAGDSSAFGTSPRALIVREDAVSEVELPQPAALGGDIVGVSGGTATGASGNRMVFAGGVHSVSSGSVGYYAAVVQLGDGGGVPDARYTRFGTEGAASFRFRPQDSACPGQTAPVQPYANISSWGDATLLVGYAIPDCDESFSPTQLLTARIATDAPIVFRDGFES